MAKPGTVPDWASDTNFSTSPASGENGTPTKVAPSAGYLAEGFVPGKNFVGQYVNYLLNLIVSWISYLNLSGTDELTYASARTRVITPGFRGSARTDLAGISTYLNATGAGANTGSIVMLWAVATAGSNKCSWAEPLDLPAGAVLTGWRAKGWANANSGSNTAGLNVYLKKITSTVGGTSAPSETSLGATKTFTSAAGLSTLSSDALSETIDGTAQYVIVFDQDATGAADWAGVIYGLELTYTETRATGSY